MKRIRTILVILIILYSTRGMGMGLDELKGRHLNQSEVKELLSDKNWKKDAMLTSFFGDEDTYVNPHSKFVLTVDWDGKGGTLFPDRDIVYRVATSPDTLAPTHMLQGTFRYGKDFPAQAKSLSKQFLKKELSIPAADQFSVESLKSIDDYIARYGSAKLLHPDLFPGLLAYIGETLKKNYSMSWEMDRAQGDVWEPWLVDKAGNKYPIFAVVYRELYNFRKGHSSVYGAVIGEIQKNRFRVQSNDN